MDAISVLEHKSMSVPGGDNRLKDGHFGPVDRLSTGVRPTASCTMIIGGTLTLATIGCGGADRTLPPTWGVCVERYGAADARKGLGEAGSVVRNAERVRRQ